MIRKPKRPSHDAERRKARAVTPDNVRTKNPPQTAADAATAAPVAPPANPKVGKRLQPAADPIPRNVKGGQ